MSGKIEKDRLKNMHGTTPQVAMLANVRVPQCKFDCIPMGDWTPMTRAFVTPFGCT